ncbi:hypothetical protein [Spirillospora sp. NPDC047279]|uniref:hypothetical protein n=1 Tax=Spirillospora sp. NPDC047279 TaxID=3155478 RepID=UPI0033E12711
MNELTEVRALFDDPPEPDARVVTAARARMTERRMPQRPPRRRRRAGLRLALPGVVAVGAAATVAVATLGGGAGAGPGTTPGPQKTELNARGVLLAAASQAEKQPEGRYWRKRTVAEAVSYPVGGYVVTRSSEGDTWSPRSASDTYVDYRRPLGVGPATDADRAAWREAGSPRTWRVRTADDPRWMTLTMSGPGAWETYRTTGAERRRLCGCDVEPWVERDRIARQPGGLEKLLFAEERRPGGLRLDAANTLLGGYQILTEATSPQVRGAAFRMLADRPGISLVEGVRDMKGRAGVALVGRGRTIGGGSGVFDVQVILHPTTFAVLGRQYVVVERGTRFPGLRPGAVVERQAVLHAGWTSEAPHH